VYRNVSRVTYLFFLGELFFNFRPLATKEGAADRKFFRIRKR